MCVCVCVPRDLQLLSPKAALLSATCADLLRQLELYDGDVLVVGTDAKVGKGKAPWRVSSFGLYIKDPLASRTNLKRDARGAPPGSS